MTLLLLLLLLIVPYLILTLAIRLVSGFDVAPPSRAKVGLSLFFLFTAIGHFLRPTEMSAMVPSFFPYPVAIIYLTGVFELLGATGIWIRRLKKTTGFCLILMLVCLLPINIYSAISRVDFGGHGAGPAYLFLRVPFQFFVIWWTYYATEQGWFAKHPKEV